MKTNDENNKKIEHNPYIITSLIARDIAVSLKRPCTVVKGGECCHFHFYRKGTAPDIAYLNK